MTEKPLATASLNYYGMNKVYVPLRPASSLVKFSIT